MSLQLFVLFNFCLLILSAFSFYSTATPLSPHDHYGTSQDLKLVGMLIIIKYSHILWSYLKTELQHLKKLCISLKGLIEKFTNVLLNHLYTNTAVLQ